jgi:hypothetical protein|tara:strand:- start:271 stop:486 length:216 start_codon:yes stop_codon:yes gene_type:complete
MSEENRELTSTELTQIANQLNAQVSQLNLVVKDLSDKLSRKEVENSQLRAIVTQITGQQQQTAGDVESEEE